mmetsp:Transcript_11175/g.26855  ORF Transcript_11175/g.26855 Transcript_11175/m.26855 type:complete len:101 (-) Transcript_11175:11-313(-)
MHRVAARSSSYSWHPIPGVCVTLLPAILPVYLRRFMMLDTAGCLVPRLPTKIPRIISFDQSSVCAAGRWRARHHAFMSILVRELTSKTAYKPIYFVLSHT